MRILAVAMVAIMLAIAGLTYDLFTQYTLAKNAGRSFGFADYTSSVSTRIAGTAPVAEPPAGIATQATPATSDALAKKSGAVSAFLSMFSGKGKSGDSSGTDGGGSKTFASSGGAKPVVVSRSGGCGGTAFCKVGGN
ncbi:hypothetical protein VK792_09505 [Mesobacterium sp. TK19101]|uniref:Uncharacterized protein n=1 Tax=Mesobacterium hydrothermale TaxID=3111907 RepID=A0ABU6HJ98_9RHOB|nr:hypothetical protein [Mesobacterium sp. TK19101]MEC3861518.1 hypothetical protein [Mesobacterium sp. TK19101]